MFSVEVMGNKIYSPCLFLKDEFPWRVVGFPYNYKVIFFQLGPLTVKTVDRDSTMSFIGFWRAKMKLKVGGTS